MNDKIAVTINSKVLSLSKLKFFSFYFQYCNRFVDFQMKICLWEYALNRKTYRFQWFAKLKCFVNHYCCFAKPSERPSCYYHVNNTTFKTEPIDSSDWDGWANDYCFILYTMFFFVLFQAFFLLWVRENKMKQEQQVKSHHFYFSKTRRKAKKKKRNQNIDKEIKATRRK